MDMESGQKRASGKVQVGDHAPDFTLEDQSGKEVHFSDLLGKKNIVLYFYPKDETVVVQLRRVRFAITMKYSRMKGQKLLGSVLTPLHPISSLPQSIACLSYY